MSNQDFERQSSTSRGGDNIKKNIAKAADSTVSNASQLAQQATRAAKKTAADSASTVGHQIKELLDGQIAGGADTIGHFASSTKRAADDLSEEAPQLANVVRTLADRIENYADDLRNKSFEQLASTASDFTRRQPALVFGLAALAGFLAFRTVRSAPGQWSASTEPISEGERRAESEFHGT